MRFTITGGKYPLGTIDASNAEEAIKTYYENKNNLDLVFQNSREEWACCTVWKITGHGREYLDTVKAERR